MATPDNIRLQDEEKTEELRETISREAQEAKRRKWDGRISDEDHMIVTEDTSLDEDVAIIRQIEQARTTVHHLVRSRETRVFQDAEDKEAKEGLKRIMQNIDALQEKRCVDPPQVQDTSYFVKYDRSICSCQHCLSQLSAQSGDSIET